MDGTIVLHMDFCDIFFDTDLEHFYDTLRFELSCVIGVAGRNMRLQLLARKPQTFEVGLELAYNEPSVEEVSHGTVKEVFHKLRSSVHSNSLQIAGTVWARRISDISILDAADI